MKVLYSAVFGISLTLLLAGCSNIKSPDNDIDFASPNPGTQYDQASQPQNSNPNVLAGKMMSY